jgi:hypothetical protein
MWSGRWRPRPQIFREEVGGPGRVTFGALTFGLASQGVDGELDPRQSRRVTSPDGSAERSLKPAVAAVGYIAW